MPASFVEEIHLHLPAEDQEKFLGLLDQRILLREMRMGRDGVADGQRHEADLERPFRLGNKICARPKIVQGENQGIRLVDIKRPSHKILLLRIENPFAKTCMN